MNVPLLLEIADRIAKRPEQFYMVGFKKPSPCGTVCCIAGWASILSGDSGLDGDSLKAGKVLGLNIHEMHRLFLYYNWPKEFQLWHPSTKGERTPEFAENAIRRIHHFIQTGGRE